MYSCVSSLIECVFLCLGLGLCIVSLCGGCGGCLFCFRVYACVLCTSCCSSYVAICVLRSLLIFVEDTRGNHMDEP